MVVVTSLRYYFGPGIPEDFLCPVAALRNHLSVNADLPPSSSLFSYHEPSASCWSHVIKKNFLDHCQAVWTRCPHLDIVFGHSFRIGSACFLLSMGVSPEVVAKAGCWSSLAFLLYWRRVEEVISLATSIAFTKSRLDNVSASLEQFRINNHISTSAVVLDSDS